MFDFRMTFISASLKKSLGSRPIASRQASIAAISGSVRNTLRLVAGAVFTPSAGFRPVSSFLIAYLNNIRMALIARRAAAGPRALDISLCFRCNSIAVMSSG